MRSFGARARRAAAGALLVLTAGWVPVLVPGPAPAAAADEIRDRQERMLTTLDVRTAWRTTRGAGVTVAVVDSGVDARQADLAGSVTTGPNMLAAIDGRSRPARLHGTGMASLIAGHGHGPGRRDGIIGVAPQAKILSIRALAEREDPSFPLFRSSERAEDAVARGIRYAADHGADVINLSLGKPEENPVEREAIAYAIAKGVVVVSAAGNDGDKRDGLDGDGFAPYSYPASYPGVIAVAATDADHGRARFSNRNYSVLVSAPGSGLPVAGPGSDYFLTDGTSDSTALVSGIAALIRSKHPKLPPALVAQAIIAGTRYGPKGTYNPEIGFGEVNAARSLTAAATLTKAPRPGAAGKPADQRYGTGEQEPVEVIPRPAWINIVITVVITVGVVGALAAVLIAVTLARRHPRNPRGGFAAPLPADGADGAGGAGGAGGQPPYPQPAYQLARQNYWTPPPPEAAVPSGRPVLQPPAPDDVPSPDQGRPPATSQRVWPPEPDPSTSTGPHWPADPR
jgi:type VII secretion-associated serine protease mycosin